MFPWTLFWVFRLSINKKNTEFFTFLELNLSSFLEIVLVTNEVFDNTLICQFLDFVEPVRDPLEGRAIWDIINDEYSLSPSIIAAHNCLKSVLSCGVPLKIAKNCYNLKFDRFAIDVHVFKFLWGIDENVRNQRRLWCSSSAETCFRCIA